MRFLKKFIVSFIEKIPTILIAALLVFPVWSIWPAWAEGRPLEKGTAVEYSIRVSIQPEEGTLSGQARIELPDRPGGGKWLLHVQELDALAATLNGKALKPKDGHLRARRGTLIVNYEMRGGAGGSDPPNPGVGTSKPISLDDLITRYSIPSSPSVSLPRGWLFSAIHL